MSRAERHTDVPLCLSEAHDCGYLSGRRAALAFVHPQHVQATQLASYSQAGFRRSGDLIYRPHCPQCRACVAVRVPVADFKPSRSQQRTLRRNADLVVRQHPWRVEHEHFALYRRYQRGRHRGGDMDHPEVDRYRQFLDNTLTETWNVDFRGPGGRTLKCVAVFDVMDNALSAVYTFFDPESRRGLGIHALLWQIGEAQRRGLSYLYLGYYIGACRKMSYKGHFRPLEAFVDGHWRRFPDGLR